MVRTNRFFSIAATAAVFAASIVLSGCTASGPKYETLAPTIPPIAKESGRIYFYRSANPISGAATPDIYLDGRIVGTAKMGSFFYVERKPGTHYVTLNNQNDNQLQFSLGEGETKYVKTTFNASIFTGDMIPSEIDPNVASSELDHLSYVGPFAKSTPKMSGQ